MNLAAFSEKVKAYLKDAGLTQKMLAKALALDPSLLSHKLNGTGRSQLTHHDIYAIVKVLAGEEAITYQEEALELLALLNCPDFPQNAWLAAPLNKLKPVLDLDFQPGTTARAAKNPAKTPGQNAPNSNSDQGPAAESFKNNHQQALSRSTDQLHNLPHQLSSFIGRHKEMAELKKLLTQEKVRLVSLVGAGGCGKSRLSLQVASELVGRFTDGVWLVQLAPINDPILIPQTIAAALGISVQGGRSILSRVSEYLRSRHLLLILDNCEHLVEDCARIVETLIQETTRLHVLVTSREALNLKGELIFRIPSLTFPFEYIQANLEELTKYEAVILFIERAVAGNADFTLGTQNAGAVVQVCRKLDGIPLAIELAAARIKVLTVEQIAARLTNRFQLLKGGSRTDLPRHQTLQALIDWSYNLLSESEKRLLVRLSVFSGGWTLEAAEAVCGNFTGSLENLEVFEVLDSLTSLVNKSLVQIDPNKTNIEPHYYLLETIRQYGLQKLESSGERQAIQERHLAYYSKQSAELTQKLVNQSQGYALQQLDLELNNIRVAIDYGLKGERLEAVAKLCFNYYWEIRSYWEELQRYLEQLLAKPPAPALNRGRVLQGIFLCISRLGGREYPQHLVKECLKLVNEDTDKETKMWAFYTMVFIHRDLWRLYSNPDDSIAALEYLGKALALSEELKLPEISIRIRFDFGGRLLEIGELTRANSISRVGLLAAKEIGNRLLVAVMLGMQARIALALEDNAAAHQYLEEKRIISEEIGFFSGKIDALCYRSYAWTNEGKFEEARRSLDESLVMCLKRDMKNLTANSLVGVARLLSKLWQKNGQTEYLEKAAYLIGAISALVGTPNSKIPLLVMPMRKYYAEALELARTNLDATVFSRAFEKGQAMSMEEAIWYARRLLGNLDL
jgi:non-specific serine/threonine protein kinase